MNLMDFAFQFDSLKNFSFSIEQIITLFCLTLIVVAFFISVVLAKRRLVKVSSKRLILVWSLVLFSTLGLLGLVLVPKVNTQSGIAVQLITKGGEALIDSSVENSYWLNPSFKNIEEFEIRRSQIIYSVEQLRLKFPRIDRLSVIGKGLTKAQLDALSINELSFSQQAIPSGIIEPKWTKTLNRGDRLTVSGQVNIEGFDAKQVFEVNLVDPAGTVVAKSDVLNQERFRLTDRPRLYGAHWYKILLKSKQSIDDVENIISEELLDVTVTNNAEMILLILQSAPSFETKQLHRWGSENSARILVKTQISKKKYITQNINIEELTHKDINVAFFSQFDLIVSDARAISRLSKTEEAWLKQSLKSSTGLFVFADGELNPSKNKKLWLSELFPVEALDDLSGQTLQEESISWLSGKSGVVPASDLPLPRLPFKFGKSPEIKPLVFNQTGETLVAKKSFGKGRIGLSLVRESQRWVTSGDLSHYSFYWQHLIQSLAAEKVVNRIVSLNSQMINRVESRQTVCINRKRSAEPTDFRTSNLVLTHEEDERIILLQPSRINNLQYCGVFWPTDSGWHRVSEQALPNNKTVPLADKNTSNITEKLLYVYSDNDWKSHLLNQNYKAMSARQRQLSQMKAKNYDNESIEVFTPIPKKWFWWLFVVSACLLWWERKNYSNFSTK